MTKLIHKFSMRAMFNSFFALLFLPALAVAAPEDVLNENWVVTVTKKGFSTADCSRESCFLVEDRFEVQVNSLSPEGVGSGTLKIRRGGWEVRFEALIQIDRQEPPAVDWVDVTFIDHMVDGSNPPWDFPLKRLRLTLVENPLDESGQSSTCKSRFEGSSGLGKGRFSSRDLAAACPSREDANPVVHWSVCELRPTYNCDEFNTNLSQPNGRDSGDMRGVPDDGQGAGGPPD